MQSKIRKSFPLAELVLNVEAIKLLNCLICEWDKSTKQRHDYFYSDRLKLAAEAYSQIVSIAKQDLKLNSTERS